LKTTKAILKKNGASFAESGYVIVRNFVNVSDLYEPMLKKLKEGIHDEQCPKSLALYNTPMMNDLLERCLPIMEKHTGLALFKTYAYCRLYVKGEELKKHSDRPACEISATLCIGYKGKNWPIWITDYSGKDISVELDAGDALLYHGCEMTHWREENQYSHDHVQVFLHYVDQNGMYADHKDDAQNKHMGGGGGS
jgi:ectoine hydroxylase-related dioxygenase (phytanoyl-CoA dioxygenase family)